MAMVAAQFVLGGGMVETVSAAEPIKFSLLRSVHSGAINLTGNQFVYDKQTDTFIATGDAIMSQGPTVLHAQRLQYDRRQRIAIAEGKVVLTDPEVRMTGTRAAVNITDETGNLTNGAISVKRGNYYLAGKRITKLLGQHYVIQDGYFTTCGCEEGAPSWSVKGKELDIHLGGTAQVEDAQLSILDHPLVPLPFAVFPADTDRQSGLLSPRIGESRLRGFQYFQPYFIDIDKSQDATVAVDLETSARVGMMGEYRLQNGPDDFLRVTAGGFNESLRTNTSGEIVDDQISSPTLPRDFRYGLIGAFHEHITDSISVYGDTVTVSDALYLRDMDVWTLSRGYGSTFSSNFNQLRTADSHFGLIDEFDDSFLRIQGSWTQDLIQFQGFQLQQLPEVLWSGRQQVADGLAFVDYDTQGVYYHRAQGSEGQRLDFFPRLTLPFRLSNYFTSYVQVGARETLYDSSGQNIGIVPVGTVDPYNGQYRQYNNALYLSPQLGPGGFNHRELLYGRASVSTVLERIFDFHHFGIDKLKNTIEPFTEYDFVPNVNQNNLPLWDDVDRVNARSLFSYGVISRLFAKFNTSEGDQPVAGSEDATLGDAAAAAGQPVPTTSYEGGSRVMEVARLTLMQDYDTSHQVTPDGAHTSDIMAGLALFPNSMMSLVQDINYNPNTRQIASEQLSLIVRPPWLLNSQQTPTPRTGRALTGGSFLQLGYTFVGGSQAVHAISGRVYYEFLDRLGVYWGPEYDIADGKMLTSEYGVRLKSKCDCWIADFAINDSINPSEVQLQFQVTLGGLGSIGHAPFGRNPLPVSMLGGNPGIWQPY